MAATTGSVPDWGRGFKWGGAAALIGALLLLVGNLLHPRASEYTSEAELDMVAGSDIWLLDHFVVALGFAFLLIGLIAISGYIEANGGDPTWTRVARAAAVGGVVVGYLTIAVDGFALKEVADNYAANPDTRATAEAVSTISLALFTALMGSTLGLTPLLFGIAMLMTPALPRSWGWVSLVGGALGLIAGTVQYFNGPSSLSINFLFTPASLLVTVWLFVVGWKLYNDPGVAAPPPASAERHSVAV